MAPVSAAGSRPASRAAAAFRPTAGASARRRARSGTSRHKAGRPVRGSPAAQPPIQIGGPPGRCGIGPSTAPLDRPAARPSRPACRSTARGRAAALEHAADALLERHAAGDELGADVRHVAGDADAEDEAAFADLVERRDLCASTTGLRSAGSSTAVPSSTRGTCAPRRPPAGSAARAAAAPASNRRPRSNRSRAPRRVRPAPAGAPPRGGPP